MNTHLYQEMYYQESYYWWHTRKRLLISYFIRKYLEKKSLSKERLTILDMGCGTGKMMEEAEKFGEVYGVDFSEEAIKFCKKRNLKNLYKCDLNRKLPFKKESFNIVLILDVLEHLNDDKKILTEIMRILKRGGILIAIVPAYQKLFSYWDEALGHKRRYNKNDLERKMISSGYSVFKLTHFNSFALIPAILVRYFKSRNGNERFKSDFIKIPHFFNLFLLYLSKIEQLLLSKQNIPFGLSIIAIAAKK